MQATLEFPARAFLGWRFTWFIIKGGLREPVLNKTLLVGAFPMCDCHCLSSPLMSRGLTVMTLIQSQPVLPTCSTHTWWNTHAHTKQWGLLLSSGYMSESELGTRSFILFNPSNTLWGVYLMKESRLREFKTLSRAAWLVSARFKARFLWLPTSLYFATLHISRKKH